MSRYTTAIIAGVIAAAVMTFFMSFVWEGFMPCLYGGFTGALVAYIFGNFAGNRKVATAGAAQKEAALALKPPPGKSLLVVYRDGFVAKLAGLDIAVDGTQVTQLTAPKFTVLTLPAGAHRLTCGFGGLVGPQVKPGIYDVEVAADGVAAVGIRVRFGAVQGSMSFTPIAGVDDARAKVARMPMALASPAEI